MVDNALTAAKPDLRALTGLRGIAAWFIVFYHIRTGMDGYLPQSIMDVLAKGYLAVDFFFLLSGFVIWLSYSARFATKGTGYSLSFYWRRIARIWPLHVLILAATVAFVVVLILTGRDSQSSYPLQQLPLHIFLLQNWGLTDQLTWNHPAWSISTEMAAYLIFPILAVYARWERFPTALLLVFIAGLIGTLYFYFEQFDYQTLGEDIPKTGLFRCLLQFTVGTIICVIWQRWRNDWQKAAYASLFSLIFLILFLSENLAETFAIPMVFASLLLAMAIWAEARGNPLNNRMLHYFGEISYATYLVHFMLFIAFKIIFVDDPGNISPIYIGLFITLTFAVSAALYHWIEKPGQRLFQQISLSKPKTLAAK